MDLQLTSTGLIAIGSRPGMGKTVITLNLANQLAASEKVVFLSYQDFKERLLSVLKQQEQKLRKDLIINTTFEYLDGESLATLRSILKEQGYSTLIIDDLDHCQKEDHQRSEYEKDFIIKELKRIAEDLGMRIIVNVSLSKQLEHRMGDNRPMVRDFTWSRRLINDCSQIFSIFRPAHYAFVEDEEGNPTDDVIEIDCLKNLGGEEFSVWLDNKEEKIIPIHYE
jgi:replicative DNA helicase